MTPSPNGFAIYATDDHLVARIKNAASQLGLKCVRLFENDLAETPLAGLPELILLCAPAALIAGFCERAAAEAPPEKTAKARIITCTDNQTEDEIARLFISTLRDLGAHSEGQHPNSLPPLPPIDWSEEEEALFLSHDPDLLKTVITAQQVARVAVDIVIEGETGVGKDTLARKIHAISGRTGRFIGVNCAAVPENLVESEFFGVDPGAFTGAVKARPGKIEAADGGTLYLDEIDSMPIWMQAKLLRALQERGCERLGSTKFIPSDFRTIASSRVPLERMVAQGHFRSDLYYRLNVVSLKLPSIRNRASDVPKLFQRFVRQSCETMKLPVPPMSSEVEAVLATYDWPGNLRELRAAAARFALNQPPVPTKMPLEARLPLKDRMRGIERALIAAALERHGGSVQHASEELNVPPYTLYYRLKALGIALPKIPAALQKALAEHKEEPE